MSKLTFKVYRNKPVEGQFIRTNDRILELVNQIRRETGLSATKIIEACLEFAAENYEVEVIGSGNTGYDLR